ncbi:MAG: caspase family protein [Pleurocapsa sp. MO_226.B13]|nr:caspase family protein [Pleurocapsa sp. MO_226.B13]
MSRDALVVGINRYQWQGLPNLRSPARDAEAIAQILEKSGDFQVQRLPEFLNPFENHAPRIARHKEVTLEHLEAALVQLFNSEAETALFFFSGHGLRKEGETHEGFLAT